MSSFLYQEVYDDILKKIINKEYKLNMLLPSENRLCEIYHVSIITVRRALSQLASDNIVEKIKGKGTVVKAAIQQSENVFDGNIGILVITDNNRQALKFDELPFSEQEYNRNPWVHLIYSSVYKKLSQDYNILLGSYETDKIIHHFEETIFADIQRIFLISANKDVISFLLSQKKQLVTLNVFEPNLRFCSIVSNDRQCVCDSIGHLVSLGHKNIAIISGYGSYGASLERFMGFQEALIKNGLPIDYSMIKWGDMTAASGYHLTKELFIGFHSPTAIFCSNDNMALGCITALNELGLKCPEDVSVIGYDNNPYVRESLMPSLSTIDPDYERIGEVAAERLSREVWFNDVTHLESKLLLRGSVSEAKDK